MPLGGGVFEQLYSPVLVFVNARAIVAAHTEVVLRFNVTLVGSEPVHLHSLRLIFVNPRTFVVAHAEVVLCARMTLVGGQLEQPSEQLRRDLPVHAKRGFLNYRVYF